MGYSRAHATGDGGRSSPRVASLAGENERDNGTPELTPPPSLPSLPPSSSFFQLTSLTPTLVETTTLLLLHLLDGLTLRSINTTSPSSIVVALNLLLLLLTLELNLNLRPASQTSTMIRTKKSSSASRASTKTTIIIPTSLLVLLQQQQGSFPTSGTNSSPSETTNPNPLVYNKSRTSSLKQPWLDSLGLELGLVVVLLVRGGSKEEQGWRSDGGKRERSFRRNR